MKNKLKVSNSNKFRYGKQFWWIDSNCQVVSSQNKLFLVRFFDQILKGFSKFLLFFSYNSFLQKSFIVKVKLLTKNFSYYHLLILCLIFGYWRNSFLGFNKLKNLGFKQFRSHKYFFFTPTYTRAKLQFLFLPYFNIYRTNLLVLFNSIRVDLFTIVLLKVLKKKIRFIFFYQQLKNYILFLITIRMRFEKILEHFVGIPITCIFHNQFFRVYSQKYWLTFHNMVNFSKLYLLKTQLWKNFCYLVFVAILENNLSMLAKSSAFLFQQGRYQQQTLIKIKKLFNTILNMGWGVLSFKIILYGKSKRNPKTSIKKIDFGYISGIKLQNYAYNVFYGFHQAETYVGSFGFHIWMCRQI